MSRVHYEASTQLRRIRRWFAHWVTGRCGIEWFGLDGDLHHGPPPTTGFQPPSLTRNTRVARNYVWLACGHGGPWKVTDGKAHCPWHDLDVRIFKMS